jgi:predicted DNA-binding transcriptional regulator YafY
MNDTILRFLSMLRMLPRVPRKIGTATLERRLHDEGYAVTRRTIQRDLHQLARAFPLLCDGHHDTLLGADQVIEELDDDRALVRATVQDTAELHWWLLGFGELVEVRAPAALREQFRQRAGAMAALYHHSTPSMATRQRSRRSR